jgi:epoxide hydrolase 4
MSDVNQAHWVDLPGLRMHTVREGPESGPAVILLHGFPEFWYSWRFQIPALAQAGFRVIVPDQRGYNLTEKHGPYDVGTLVNDIVRLQDAAGIPRSHVVGHDWGAVVAWALAALRPERVDKLAILNGPHPNAYLETCKRHPRQIAMSWYIGLFQIPGVAERLVRANDFQVLDKMFSKIPDRYMTREDIGKYKDALRQPGALSAALGWYREMPRRLMTGSMALSNPHIAAPTLVVWGERDPALAKECNDPLPNYVPDLRVHYLPNAGHWVQMDHPDEVNRQLLDFFSTSPHEY